MYTHRYLKIDMFELFERLARGTRAIEEEFASGGTDDDKENLDYVLHQRAGTSGKEFDNGVRDEGRCGETLADFMQHPSTIKAELREAHVVALRVYTTAAFRSLNGPLRDSTRTTPHPFAATLFFLTDAIRKLRAVEVASANLDLWRGMRDISVGEQFVEMGGTEVAPMSTTCDPTVAVAYGTSELALPTIPCPFLPSLGFTIPTIPCTGTAPPSTRCSSRSDAAPS